MPRSLPPGVDRLPSGRYRGTVEIPAAGRRRRKTKSFDRAADAGAWVQRTRDQMRSGRWRDPSTGNVLFEDFGERWWAARNIEPETARGERYVWNNHVLKKWRGWLVPMIGRLEVQSWVTRMTKDGVGQATVSRAYGLFRSCLLAAVEEDVIDRTPCRKISLPERSKAAPKWWTPSEVEVIIDRLGGCWQVIAALMVWCGLRWEEAAALRVTDVNWLRREVTVEQVIVRGRIKAYPKTAAGYRTLPLHDRPADLLRPAWQVAADAGRALLWESPAKPGEPVAYMTWWNHWQLTVKGVRDGRPVRGRTPAAVPQHSPHTLRHTFASWLAQAGVPMQDIQRAMGHDDPTSTAVYAHLSPEHSNKKIAAALITLAAGDASHPPHAAADKAR